MRRGHTPWAAGILCRSAKCAARAFRAWLCPKAKSPAALDRLPLTVSKHGCLRGRHVLALLCGGHRGRVAAGVAAWALALQRLHQACASQAVYQPFTSRVYCQLGTGRSNDKYITNHKCDRPAKCTHPCSWLLYDWRSMHTHIQACSLIGRVQAGSHLVGEGPVRIHQAQSAPAAGTHGAAAGQAPPPAEFHGQ